jgi:hypothetical protein
MLSLKSDNDGIQLQVSPGTEPINVIPFSHDGFKGLIARVGPAVVVTAYEGEQTFALVGTYMQNAECESAIVVWRVDSPLAITHTHIGAAPWQKHWEIFMDAMPASVRSAVARHRDRFGDGQDF